eukprot:590_1
MTPSSNRKVKSLPSEPSWNGQTRNGEPGIGPNMNHSNSGFSFIKKGGSSSGSRDHVVTRKEMLEKVPFVEEGSSSDNGPESSGNYCRIRKDGSISISPSVCDTPKSSYSCFRAMPETEMTIMLNTTQPNSTDAQQSNSFCTSNPLSELVRPISSKQQAAEPMLEEVPKGIVVTKNSEELDSNLVVSSQCGAEEGVVAKGIPITVTMNVSRAQPLSYGKKKRIARLVGYRRESDEMMMPSPSMVLTSPLQSSESLGVINSERRKNDDHQVMGNGNINSQENVPSMRKSSSSSTNTLKTRKSLESVCDGGTEIGTLSKKFSSPLIHQAGGEEVRDDSIVSLSSPVCSSPHSPHSSAALPTSQFEPTDFPQAVASDRGVLIKKKEENKKVTVHQQMTKEQVEGEEGRDLSNAITEKVEDEKLGRSTAICRNVVREWSEEVLTSCRELDTCTTAILDRTECQVKAIKSEAVAVDTLAATEAEQAELAEAEDFEAADFMNGLVQDKQRVVDEARKRVSSLKVDREALIQQLWHRRAAVLTSLKQGKEHVEDAIVVATKESARVDAEKKAEFEALDQCMKEKESRLIMEQNNVERDIALLQDERQQLESVIDGQTVGEETRRMELVAERIKLDDELTALLKAVDTKIEQMKGVEEELVGVDGAIGRVRTKFERQLQRLADMEHLMCVSREECESELVALRTEMEGNQAEVQKRKDVQRAVTEDVEFASTELKASASLLEALSSHWETLGCDSSDEGAMEVLLSGEVDEVIKRDDHASLLLSFSNAESALRVTEEAALKNAALRREYEIEVATISAQLPELEVSKRASIASRDYKEAASLSRQIKAMEYRKIKALEGVDEVSRVDYAIELKVQRLEAEKAAQALEAVEQEIARLRLERLMRAMECLQTTVNRICSIYGDSLLLSTAVMLLNSELNASKLEVTGLVEKHKLHSIACDVAPQQCTGNDQNRKPKIAEEKINCVGMKAATNRSQQSIVQQKKFLRKLKEDLECLEQRLALALLDEDFDKAVELDDQIQTMSKTISEFAHQDGGQRHEENQASAVQIEESEISGVHEPEDETEGAVLSSHIEGEKKTLNNPELGVECLTAVEYEAVALQSDDITICSSTLNQTIPRNQIRGVTVSNPEDHKCEEADISPETLDDIRVADDDDASPRGIPQQ